MDQSKRIATAHFRKAIEKPHTYLKFVMDEINCKKWYVLIHNFSGNEDEYESGQYVARIELPNNYPFEPPQFYFMTPNGVYDTEKKVCISIGEFHKSNYPATLGALGFCEQLLSGLIGWKELGHGISLLDTSTADKKRIAKQSISYNTTYNKKYIDMINESHAEYSKKW